MQKLKVSELSHYVVCVFTINTDKLKVLVF